MEKFIIAWIVIATIWAFVLMGYDKSQAKLRKQRVSEKRLWTVAIFGGGIGAYLGMQYFRHKTKHTSFRIGFFILFLLTIAAVLWLLGFGLPEEIRGI